MYMDVVQRTRIRRRVLIGGVSLRRVARDAGISRPTARKMLQFSVPPGYRRTKPVRCPKLDPYKGIINQILLSDEGLPKNQKHTAKRIYERLRDEHDFAGGYTIVKDCVREARPKTAANLDYDGCSRPEEGLEDEDPAKITYALVQSLPRSQGLRLLRTLLGGEEARPDSKELERLLARFPRKVSIGEKRLQQKQAAFDWMREVLQGTINCEVLAKEVGEPPDLGELHAAVLEGRLCVRNKALSVLARKKGFSITTVQSFLDLSKASVLKYLQCYDSGGVEALMARRGPLKKSDEDRHKRNVFALFHTPPSEYTINRTTWKMDDFQSVLRQQDQYLCKDVIRAIFKKAKYKWRTARVVLTSKDPDYRVKVDAIRKILTDLGPDEAFFSIDEYGPFAVKIKGGRKRVGPGQRYTVPQWQKSKGWMILTAALELSRNQVTHFYSKKKNTEEMIKLADLLLERYRGYRTLYLSWDAASWHVSKKLEAHLRHKNETASLEGHPMVKTAPLPAGAQFLNVIESVFSGMAREIVPNLVEGGRAAVLKLGSLRESSKPFTTKENRREETISHSRFRKATASQPPRSHSPAQPKRAAHAALG